MKKAIWYLLIIPFFHPHLLFAGHHLNFEHLPVNGATCIVQDRLGFIWVGTYDGLNRLDAHQSKEYRHDPDNPASLSDNYIRAICEDRNGKLWIGTRGGGLNYFDPNTEQFVRFRHDPNDIHSLSDDRVEAIFEDHEGFLWVGTWGGGLNRVEPVMDGREIKCKIVRFRHDPDIPESLSDNSVFVILEDRANQLWVGTWKGGLNLLDRESGHFSHFQHEPQDPFSIGQGAIRAIYEDHRQNLWIGLWGGGLQRLNRQTKQFMTYRHDPDDPTSLANDRVWTIYEDHRQNLWIGTRGGGLNLLNRSTRQFAHYRHDPYDPSSLSDDYVRAIFEDRQGNLWIGMDTEWFGLDRLDENSLWINHYRHDPEDANSILDDYVRGILEDRHGDLWVGTIHGLNHIDRTSGKVTHYQHDPNDPHSLSKALIRSIYEDRQGQLWIGTWGGGLDRLDRATGHFEHFRHHPEEPHSLSNDMVFYGLYEDRQGNFWVGTYGGGLNRMDRKTGQFEHFYHNPKDPNSLSDNIVRTILEDSNGNLWIGLEGGGLNRMDRETGRFERFCNDPDDSLSISANYVNVIHEDEKGRVWVGTWGGGLNLLHRDPAGGRVTFRRYREKDGLSNNIIFGILEDEEGNLWISTRSGLSRFNPDQETFDNYDFEVNNRQINHWAYFRGRDGIFYFGGGIGGIYYFHPKDVIDAPYVPPVVFTRFARYDRRDKQAEPIIDPGINQRTAIVLSHRNNILEFEFSALNFIKPERNQYAYRIFGLSEQWISLGNKHHLTLTNLDPGKYTLHVIGADSKGNWNDIGRKLTIRIRPPWYWREWSQTLYVLVLLGLFLLLRNKELQQQRTKLVLEKEKNAHLQRIDQLKDHFLSNTSHELRTPLYGIIGLSESMYEKPENIEPTQLRENLGMIISSGKRLANMVNDILDFSKLRHHEIELRRQPIQLWSLVDMILKINQSLIGEKKICLENHIPVDFPLVLADKDRLQQIIYNLVGNAIKFTDQGYVRVGVADAPESVESSDPPFIHIYVQDTGIGIAPKDQENIFLPFQQADSSIIRAFGGIGLGLSISRRLVELHGGQIWLASEKGQGATFFFSLPLAQEELHHAHSAVRDEDLVSRLKDFPNLAVDGEKTAGGLEKKGGERGLWQKGRNHILIVDDEPINHQVLKNHLLDGCNCRIVGAMSGEEALEILEKEGPFDLVLLDVMMPRMSGYEVCRRIREKFLPSELPVIMVSARNLVRDLVEGLSLGANDYLAKPFSKHELMARVQTQLELHRINSVIEKFVPSEFLHLLGRNRITEVVLGDHTERVVTVFFADIRDYTGFSETLTPRDNFRFVNAYNGRMGPFIRKHHGFINQYLGDAIMSIFPRNPVDALQAAIEMQDALSKYNEERIVKGKKMIRTGMGLHTGQLIMGIIGDQQRMDAATISDTVNTAARIESLTKHFCVNILLSEACLKKIRAGCDPTDCGYHFRYLGKVQVKGKLDTVEIHECINGDSVQSMQKKLETLEDFESGVRCFQNSRFPSAMSAFQRVLKKHPEDRTAQILLEKANFYALHGTPENWEGVEYMQDK